MTASVIHLKIPAKLMASPDLYKHLKTTKIGLAALAPRLQAHGSNDGRRPKLSTKGLRKVSKARLTPRSKLGCWTCRSRKVKCDEARPICSPCARLGQHCDYGPRVSFRDDTLRVVKRMSSASDSSGPVWSTHSANQKLQYRLQDDNLPSFATLRTDEERELKAKTRQPGTYHVVVNPASFVGYENNQSKASIDDFPSVSASSYLDSTICSEVRHTHYPLQSSSLCSNNMLKTGDPNVVVLKVFEDDSWTLPIAPRGLLSVQGQCSTIPPPSNHSTLSISPSLATQKHQKSPLTQIAHPDGRDNGLIYYFNESIRAHLTQIHRDTLGNPSETGSIYLADILERQAAHFQPLYHALMALSALRMSHARDAQDLTAIALHHYQQSLPSLQAILCSEKDLTSDGIFLTHFVLLLYELAAGEPFGISLWQQHISQLLRIVLLRNETRGVEPYSFIVWWVASIDAHIVLFELGGGIFVETMLQTGLLFSTLEPNVHCDPATLSNRSSPKFSDSGLTLPRPPSALAFHRRICILAAQLGLLARDLREEERLLSIKNCDERTIAARQRRVDDFQDLLWRTWEAEIPPSISVRCCNFDLPPCARGIFEHSYVLHRALIIYLHTSLPVPPSSSSSPANPTYNNTVGRATCDILGVAREIVNHGHLEREFIVFPLFMAGYNSSKPEERAEILSFIRIMEKGSVGKSVVAMRELLEAVYHRQDLGVGQGCSFPVDDYKVPSFGRVDWITLVKSIGWQAVNGRL